MEPIDSKEILSQYANQSVAQFREFTKKVNDLHKFIFSPRAPENAVSHMMASKMVVNHIGGLPDRGNNQLMLLRATPKLSLSCLKIKLYQNEKKLEAARRTLYVKHHLIQGKWKDIEKKERELRERFREYNKFVKENQDKRERAGRKILFEQALTEEREAMISKLNYIIEGITKTTAKMDAFIKSYKIYETYLQDVVFIWPEFRVLNDIVDRYNALVEAKKFLMEQQNHNLRILESAKADMMRLIEEKNFVIMGLNNQIANLQARYENANIKSLESEQLVTEIKNNAIKQQSEIDMVKNSVWNVYVHMTLSKKHPIKIKKDNVEEQMMYINRTLTELAKVNKLIKKKAMKPK